METRFRTLLRPCVWCTTIPFRVSMQAMVEFQLDQMEESETNSSFRQVSIWHLSKSQHRRPTRTMLLCDFLIKDLIIMDSTQALSLICSSNQELIVSIWTTLEFHKLLILRHYRTLQLLQKHLNNGWIPRLMQAKVRTLSILLIMSVLLTCQQFQRTPHKAQVMVQLLVIKGTSQNCQKSIWNIVETTQGNLVSSHKQIILMARQFSIINTILLEADKGTHTPKVELIRIKLFIWHIMIGCKR